MVRKGVPVQTSAGVAHPNGRLNFWCTSREIGRFFESRDLVSDGRLGKPSPALHCRVDGRWGSTISMPLKELSREFVLDVTSRYKGLESLNLSGNTISKLENLEILKDLRELDVSGNRVSRVEGLGGIPGLNSVSLARNRVTSIEGAPLARLQRLDLSHNQVKDFAVLEALRPTLCPALRELHLQGNPIAEEESYRKRVARQLPQLRELDGQALSETGPKTDERTEDATDDGLVGVLPGPGVDGVETKTPPRESLPWWFSFSREGPDHGMGEGQVGAKGGPGALALRLPPEEGTRRRLEYQQEIDDGPDALDDDQAAEGKGLSVDAVPPEAVAKRLAIDNKRLRSELGSTRRILLTRDREAQGLRADLREERSKGHDAIISALRGQVGSLEEKLRASNEASRSLQGDVAAVRAASDAVTAEKDALATRAAALESECDSMRRASAEAASLRERNGVLVGQLQTLEASAADARDLREKNAKLKAAAARHQATVEHLQAHYQRLLEGGAAGPDGERASADRELKAARDTAAALRQRSELLAVQNQALRDIAAMQDAAGQGPAGSTVDPARSRQARRVDLWRQKVFELMVQLRGMELASTREEEARRAETKTLRSRAAAAEARTRVLEAKVRAVEAEAELARAQAAAAKGHAERAEAARARVAAACDAQARDLASSRAALQLFAAQHARCLAQLGALGRRVRAQHERVQFASARLTAVGDAMAARTARMVSDRAEAERAARQAHDHLADEIQRLREERARAQAEARAGAVRASERLAQQRDASESRLTELASSHQKAMAGVHERCVALQAALETRTAELSRSQGEARDAERKIEAARRELAAAQEAFRENRAASARAADTLRQESEARVAAAVREAQERVAAARAAAASEASRGRAAALAEAEELRAALGAAQRKSDRLERRALGAERQASEREAAAISRAEAESAALRDALRVRDAELARITAELGASRSRADSAQSEALPSHTPTTNRRVRPNTSPRDPQLASQLQQLMQLSSALLSDDEDDQ